MDAWALGETEKLGTDLLVLSQIQAPGSARSHARPRSYRAPPSRPCAVLLPPKHSE